MTTWSSRPGKVEGRVLPGGLADEFDFIVVDLAGARTAARLGFFAARDDVGVGLVAVVVPVNPDKDRFGFGGAGVDAEVDPAEEVELESLEREIEAKVFFDPGVEFCFFGFASPFSVFLVVICHLSP